MRSVPPEVAAADGGVGGEVGRRALRRHAAGEHEWRAASLRDRGRELADAFPWIRRIEAADPQQERLREAEAREDRGRILERGTHQQLLAAGGAYARLLARDTQDVIEDVATAPTRAPAAAPATPAR